MGYKLAVLFFALSTGALVGCSGTSDTEGKVGDSAQGLSKKDGIRCGMPVAGFPDDGQVDRERLDPPLSDLNWVCKLTESGPYCLVVGAFPDDEDTGGQILPNENNPGPCGNFDVQPYARVRLDRMAARLYNNDYVLVGRDIASFGTRDFWANAEGTGATIHEDKDFCETQRLQIPGEGDSTVHTLDGTQARQFSPTYGLVNLEKGEIIRYPDGSSQIVSGRWDYDTDFEAAAGRFCEALGAPRP